MKGKEFMSSFRIYFIPSTTMSLLFEFPSTNSSSLTVWIKWYHQHNTNTTTHLLVVDKTSVSFVSSGDFLSIEFPSNYAFPFSECEKSNDNHIIIVPSRPEWLMTLFSRASFPPRNALFTDVFKGKKNFSFFLDIIEFDLFLLFDQVLDAELISLVQGDRAQSTRSYSLSSYDEIVRDATKTGRRWPTNHCFCLLGALFCLGMGLAFGIYYGCK